MDEVIKSREDLDNSWKDVKNKVDRKGWGLILVLLLVGISVGFLMGGGFNQEDTIISASCAKSIDCVNQCLTFYDGAADVNHSLECEYKCLTYKYCYEECR